MNPLAWLKSAISSSVQENLSVYSPHADPEVRASGINVISSFMTVAPTYPRLNFTSVVSEGFFKSELVNSGIKHIVGLFAQGQICVMNRTTNAIFPNHKLTKTFRIPDGEGADRVKSEHDFWEDLIVDMLLYGNAFWFKRRSNSGAVVGYQRLLPQFIGILPNLQAGINRYFYEIYGVWKPIRNHDIVHWKFPNPSTDPIDALFGASPLLPAIRNITADNEMTDFTVSMLQNYAVPGLAIVTQQTIDPKQADNMIRKFREKYGKNRRGDPAILQKGMDIKKVGLDLNELAFKDIRAATEIRILMALGGAALVYMVGARAGIENHTYASYAEARESFADDVVTPLWNRISSQLTTTLLPDFTDDRNLQVGFDTSQIPAFLNRRIKTVDSATKAFLSGMISKSEARGLIGFPASPGRDIMIMPRNEAAFYINPDGSLEQIQVTGPNGLPDNGDGGNPAATGGNVTGGIVSEIPTN